MRFPKQRVALIQWGRAYNRIFLAVPVDKAKAIMDAFAHGELFQASDFTVDKNTKFTPDEYAMTTQVTVIDADQLTPDVAIPVVSQEFVAEFDEEEEPVVSDLEERIEEAQKGGLPEELA